MSTIQGFEHISLALFLLGILLIFTGLLFISLALLSQKGARTQFFGGIVVGFFPVFTEDPKTFAMLVGAVVFLWVLLSWWVLR